MNVRLGIALVWLVVVSAGPAAAQVSTKPGGVIHGRITHVDRHLGRRCRDARGRSVRCAKKSRA